MEKTVIIDGKSITFKCTGGTMLRYRNQFNREFLVDLEKLQDINKPGYLENLTLEPFERILWTMAKTADKEIPDLQAWLDSFDFFPTLEIWKEVQDMVIKSLRVQPKNE